MISGKEVLPQQLMRALNHSVASVTTMINLLTKQLRRLLIVMNGLQVWGFNYGRFERL